MNLALYWSLLVCELRLYGDDLRADAIERCAADERFVEDMNNAADAAGVAA